MKQILSLIALCLLISLSHPAGAAAAAAGIAWSPCSEAALAAFDCGTLAVPKDYDRPGLGHFTLALMRAKATGSAADRIGTLFFNPGGPGVSGIDDGALVAAALSADLRRHFDFVAWDPRGVARSAGLTACRNGSYTLPPSGPVDWDKVVREMRRDEAAANRDCIRRYPEVVPYVSTVATARDLDTLREAVGDTGLTYWGTSYGTRIGYTYAQLFPDRVRAMLLTSPISPNASWKSFAEGAGTSPDTAAGFFFEVQPDSRALFDRAIAALDAGPLALPSGARFTRWDLRAVVADSAKSEDSFEEARAFLKTVDDALHGADAERRAALEALDRQKWETRYPINGGATAFIGCSDYADRFSPREQVKAAATLRAQAPVFGFSTAMALFFCEGSNVAPKPVPVNFINATTPMLIIGSTRDGLTQYGWVNDMARNFQNSRVVTYVGTQHTPYVAARSACVDKYATDYLVTLSRPGADVACPHAGAAP